MSESALQKRSIDKFQSYGWFVIRLNAGEAFSRNGNRLQLAPEGSPDIVVFIPGGVTVFVEFKDKTGLRESQIRTHKHLEWLGHSVLVLHSDEEVDTAFAIFNKPGYKIIRAILDALPKRQKRVPKGYESFETWESREAI